MHGIALIAARAPLEFRRGTPALRLYNVERVRSYLERNLGAGRKEVAGRLGLDVRTVSSAIKTIRGRA